MSHTYNIIPRFGEKSIYLFISKTVYTNDDRMKIADEKTRIIRTYTTPTPNNSYPFSVSEARLDDGGDAITWKRVAGWNMNIISADVIFCGTHGPIMHLHAGGTFMGVFFFFYCKREIQRIPFRKSRV